MEMKNKQRTIVYILSYLAVLFVTLLCLPFIFNMSIDIKVKTILISCPLSILSIIALIINIQEANKADKLLKSNNILARWTFSHQEWLQYIEHEKKSGLEGIVFIPTILIMCAYLTAVPDKFLFFYLLFAVLIIITFFILIQVYRASSLTKIAYVILSPYSVLLNGIFHNWQFQKDWRGKTNRLESVSYVDNINPTVISLKYSVPTKYGRMDTIIKIPVPNAEKAKVMQIIDAIKKANRQ